MDFGEVKYIRLPPMCDNEPKAAENQHFKAGSGLNALAKETDNAQIKNKDEKEKKQ